MTLSFPTNSFISHNFTNLCTFTNLEPSHTQSISVCDVKLPLIIMGTEKCQVNCWLNKPLVVTFAANWSPTLSASASNVLLYGLSNINCKEAHPNSISWFWKCTKLEHCSYFSYLLIRNSVYLPCSHHIWSVLIFLM